MINAQNNTQITDIYTDTELSIFLEKWISHGFNGTKAYLDLHPNSSKSSASVCASRLLRKVNISELLEIRNAGLQLFIDQLISGLRATRKDNDTGKDIPDHRVRFLYWQAMGNICGLFDRKEQSDMLNRNIFEQIERKYIKDS